MSHVFLVDRIAAFEPYEIEQDRLGEAGFELALDDCHTPEEVIQRADHAEIVWISWRGIVTPEVMDALPSLRLIVRAGVGYDQIDVPAATARGIAVANAPTYGTDDVAEHALALLLAWARRVPQLDHGMRTEGWPRVAQFPIHRLRGQTLGIIGLGRIGTSLARRARGLGLRVLAYDALLGEEELKRRDVEPAAFEDLLAQADYVSVHVPLSNVTRHLINAAALARMKSEALLVNTSRGPVVDEAALVDALRSGQLAGAALDVFEDEPLAPSSPLREFEQVVLTPHAAGYSLEAWNDLRHEMCDTAIDFLTTGWASPIVNPEVRPALRPRLA
jgi:D-3-phosphoglycerate dehydrogenase